MLTKEELTWIQNYSNGFDDGRQFWKEWESRPLSFWMDVVREDGRFFWKAPEIYQNNQRFKLEASKVLAGLPFDFLKMATEEVRLTGLLKSEFNSTWENQSAEFELLSCPSIGYRVGEKKRHLEPKIVAQWDRPQFNPLSPYRREIEYEFFVDGNGTEDYTTFEELFLNDKVYEPTNLTTKDVAILIEEDAEILFILSNQNKTYRLSRYANRLNEETKIASPYLALEFVEGELFNQTKRTFD